MFGARKLFVKVPGRLNEGVHMKTYVVTTAVIFGLLTVLHILRMVEEHPHAGEEPWFVLITLASAALCVWGLVLLRHRPKA